MARVNIAATDTLVDNGRTRRCAVLFKEECPEGEDNYYHDPDVEDRADA